MEQKFLNKTNDGCIVLKKGIAPFERYYSETNPDCKLFTIVWNRGDRQIVTIDEVEHEFQRHSVLPIMMSQSFRFERPGQLISWQFNREFYCLANHDAQVGCVGFVFYGPSPTMFVQLETEHQGMMDRLLAVFEEEFFSEEDIKEEMLRMLLVRLIIQVTRLAKKQYLGTEEVVTEKFNIIRQYNLLVEIHYKKEHQVQFYAGMLNKSPKTISNLFSLYSKKTPLQIIQERIIAEARRLLYYTDKSIKEIAYELEFEDVAHFSKFFKNCTAQSPSELKRMIQSGN
ncbi:MAG: helix-turn-helix domain-containing protein [Ferruginibacter sp.]